MKSNTHASLHMPSVDEVVVITGHQRWFKLKLGTTRVKGMQPTDCIMHKAKAYLATKEEKTREKRKEKEKSRGGFSHLDPTRDFVSYSRLGVKRLQVIQSKFNERMPKLILYTSFTNAAAHRDEGKIKKRKRKREKLAGHLSE